MMRRMINLSLTDYENELVKKFLKANPALKLTTLIKVLLLEAVK
jgi:hypothetical protein